VQPNNNIHIVNLEAGTCTCHRFQTHGIPCGHAISLLFSQGQTLHSWMPAVLSIATLQAQYSTPLPPVDISTLTACDTDRCEPPMTRVSRGRPKKERIRKEDTRARRGITASALHCGADLTALSSQVSASRCKTCGETGHNSRTCKRPHS
jgi:hypothetical protein